MAPRQTIIRPRQWAPPCRGRIYRLHCLDLAYPVTGAVKAHLVAEGRLSSRQASGRQRFTTASVFPGGVYNGQKLARRGGADRTAQNQPICSRFLHRLFLSHLQTQSCGCKSTVGSPASPLLPPPKRNKVKSPVAGLLTQIESTTFARSQTLALDPVGPIKNKAVNPFSTSTAET